MAVVISKGPKADAWLMFSWRLIVRQQQCTPILLSACYVV
jgi:hypothetical protein